MQNNMAFVATLKNIQKIEGADKIVSADVVLNDVKITQVVVGVDTKENTKVVYFDSNMCIEQEVIDKIDKASPDYGKEGFNSLGNYLGKGNRVKVVKLRGVISNGLAVEVEKFRHWTVVGNMNEGDSFVELSGTPICHKYVPPIKVQGQGNGKKGKKNEDKLKLMPEQFHFHIDTDQLPRNLHKINPDQVISISRKVHGTSSIYSRTLVRRPLTLKEKIAKFFGINVNSLVEGNIVASRTVVKSIDIGDDSFKKDKPGFYKVNVWTDAGEKFFKDKLHDGETVYFEIVGYLPGSESMVQKGYSYGCSKGEYKIAVYRITMTGPDGTVYEYGWEQIKARCKELGVPMVEEYFYGKVTYIAPFLNIDGVGETVEEWRIRFLNYLKEKYLEKDCHDCFDAKGKALPDEGIVVRVETLGIEVYKYKSEKFLLKESKDAEEGVENLEDSEATA